MDCQKKAACGLSNNCKYFSDAAVFGKDACPTNMIESVEQYLECLKSEMPQNGYTRFYRGHFDAEYLITPSIYRPIKGSSPEKSFVEYEHLLYREMLSRHPDVFCHCKTTVERLTIMQHYELPTRLFDVSENPLVSLYFACNPQHPDSQKVPGMLIKFDVPPDRIKYVDSDTVSVIANLAKMKPDFRCPPDSGEKSIRTAKVSAGAKREEWERYLHEIREDKPYFKDRVEYKHLKNYIVCLRPYKNNPRIIAQQGAFLLFGMKTEKNTACTFWDKGNPNIVVGNYCIHPDHKPLILNELNRLGVNEATLFPEIEKTSKWVKQNTKMLWG